METESKNAKKLHQSREFSYKKISDYRKKFIDEKTGKFDKRFTEKRSCPVCNQSDYFKIFNVFGGTYAKCNSCSMVFINPVFKDSTLEIYYKNLDTGQPTITKNEKDFYTEIYNMGLNTIGTLEKKTGLILDIGCSSGFFLDIAKEKGWQTYGIEPCKKEAKMCKGHKLLDSLDTKIKFDVITMWDVFEHIPDGNKQLKTLKCILAKDGVIFMQIPNSNSLAARVMQDKCNMFDGKEHTNIYNPKTIKKISENNGFQIVHLTTVISEMAVLNNYLSYEDPYFGTPDFSLPIDDNFIRSNLLGYKMQIAMKVIEE